MSAFGFDRIKKDFNQMKQELPPVIGVMARNFFVDSFGKQGWDDDGLHPWAARKDKGNNRALLVGKSGGTKEGAHIHLRSAVRDSLQSSSWEDINFVVKGVPYAEIHNEGGRISIPEHERVLNFRYKGADRDIGERVGFSSAGKAHFSQKVHVGAYSFHMPQRQFIGASHTLMNEISDRLVKEVGKIFKG